MKKLFDLFQVTEGNWKALWKAHHAYDLRYMTEGTWTPHEHVLEEATRLLEQVPSDSDPEIMTHVHDMLWIYYHHAITWALYRKRDRYLAMGYSGRAILYITPDNPNQLTGFLYLLTRNRAEAERYLKSIPDTILLTGDKEPGPNPDKERAREILEDWDASRI